MRDIEKAVREYFLCFLIQAFGSQTRCELRVTPLVRYVCSIYQELDEGSRLVVNQPPRTLKTWIAISFAAWRIGLNPSENILFLSATSDLAKDHVYDVREIMRSNWYKLAFPKTRIAKDKSSLERLRTTQGGSFFAGSMRSSLGGVGGTIIIVDDGNRIDDCDDADRLEAANIKFDTEILSRLNPKSGRKRKGVVLNVQHRLAENDLSGHLIKRHGFRRLAFPLLATRRQELELDDGEIWARRPGDVLLDSYSQSEIENAKRSKKPPFHFFYQQAIGSDARAPISEAAFQLVNRTNKRGTYIISIDAAQRQNGSFNVVQAWEVSSRPLHLRKQFREQCGFVALEMAAAQLISQFKPAAILIENAANGTALLDRLQRRFPSDNFIAVEPRESKDERLSRHRDAIASGLISLQETEPWIDRYVTEFAHFPKLGTDQVDATVHVLDFLATKPRLNPMTTRNIGIAGVYGSNGQPIQPLDIQPSMTLRGAVLVTGSSLLRRRRY